MLHNGRLIPHASYSHPVEKPIDSTKRPHAISEADVQKMVDLILARLPQGITVAVPVPSGGTVRRSVAAVLGRSGK